MIHNRNTISPILRERINNISNKILQTEARRKIRRMIVEESNRNVYNQSYQERGQLFGYAPAKTKRLRGRTLLRGFVNNMVVTFRKNVIYIGMRKPYYVYHHFGTRYLAVRRVITFSDRIGKKLIEILLR